MVVANQRVVSIRYIMRNNKGEELENNMSDPPISYIHGLGNIMPALESGLIGLKPGDKKSLSISGDMVTGLQEEYHFEIIIDEGIGKLITHKASSTINSDPLIKLKNDITFPQQEEYYKRKWGGNPGNETYVRPFNRF